MENNFSREDYLYLAKMAEQSERFWEMIEYVGKFAKTEGELTADERHIVSVAYKNVVGSKRAELRVLSAIEQKEAKKLNEQNITYIKQYKNIIEGELKTLCKDILTLIDKYLLVNSKSEESKIFFLKMKGDYNRYLTEFLTDNEGNDAVENAREAYSHAVELAKANLPPTHPLRLGLFLNFSVFHYEILNQQEIAIDMVRKTFDDAIQSIDSVGEESYKDVTLILQLLRDNLTLWTTDVPADDGGDDLA
jgi:14-3-3 protein epsilon